jgi:hypothetical protein
LGAIEKRRLSTAVNKCSGDAIRMLVPRFFTIIVFTRTRACLGKRPSSEVDPRSGSSASAQHLDKENEMERPSVCVMCASRGTETERGGEVARGRGGEEERGRRGSGVGAFRPEVMDFKKVDPPEGASEQGPPALIKSE